MQETNTKQDLKIEDTILDPKKIIEQVQSTEGDDYLADEEMKGLETLFNILFNALKKGYEEDGDDPKEKFANASAQFYSFAKPI